MPRAEIKYGGDEEYRRLWTIRDRYGVTWRWMLIEGAKFLEEQDLIGESAPDYLDDNRNGHRSRLTRLKPGQGDPLVQRINVSDREIEQIEIEITLLKSEGEPDTGSDAETDVEPDPEPKSDPDDAAGAAGEADSADTTSEHEPVDADEPANAAKEAEDTRDATATSSKSDPEPTQHETATKTCQQRARPTPVLTGDHGSSPGGSNDV